MKSLTISYTGDVATLTMQNGENRHNPVFAKEMLSALDSIKSNESCKALVITSNDEKCFSLGIDTDWLMPAMKAGRTEEIKQFMHDMDEVFKTLLLYPLPVIAAINGHAFGNSDFTNRSVEYQLDCRGAK